mmetsp:Transcript_49198/g.115665  ORF Transcript_49198/g.115665 Transcript_49198/m.115665 type:complete len:216 (-) Transcript_49198:1440-2087(-)
MPSRPPTVHTGVIIECWTASAVVKVLWRFQRRRTSRWEPGTRLARRSANRDLPRLKTQRGRKPARRPRSRRTMKRIRRKRMSEMMDCRWKASPKRRRAMTMGLTTRKEARLEARTKRRRRRTTTPCPAARQGRRPGRRAMHPRKLHPQRSQSHPRLQVQALTAPGPLRQIGASAQRLTEAMRMLMSEMWTPEETLLTPKPRRRLPAQCQAKGFSR